MNRFLRSDEDSLIVLPPESGAGAALEILSGRTMMVFEFPAIESAERQKNVQMDVRCFDALLLVAADALFGEKQRLLIPENHRDYPALLRALSEYAPALNLNAESEFRLEQCEHGGHHRA